MAFFRGVAATRTAAPWISESVHIETLDADRSALEARGGKVLFRACNQRRSQPGRGSRRSRNLRLLVRRPGSGQFVQGVAGYGSRRLRRHAYWLRDPGFFRLLHQLYPAQPHSQCKKNRLDGGFIACGERLVHSSDSSTGNPGLRGLREPQKRQFGMSVSYQCSPWKAARRAYQPKSRSPRTAGTSAPAPGTCTSMT